MKMKRINGRLLKRILLYSIICAVVGIIVLLILNGIIMARVETRIISSEEASALKADCILVLGAGIRDNGTPSHMLEDRLKTGIQLYEMGTAPKLLMSGDHGRIGYNEVGVMKSFSVQRGIPDSNVFMDHAGFSTYESLYRARDVFMAKKIIIVTQEYHLYRALFIAESLGLEAYGVSADLRTYMGQPLREIREIAARLKDAVLCILKPEPTYLGESIPISGDGNLTNDESYDAGTFIE